MKKFLAIILAVLMVFSLASLAACGDKKEETKAPESENTETGAPDDGTVDKATLKASKAHEYVLEKVAAGMDVSVAFISFDGTWDKIPGIKEGIQKFCDEYGFTFQYADSGTDTSKQIEQIENFVVAGNVAAIAITLSDANVMKDTFQKAEESGTYIVAYGCSPDYDLAGASFVDMIEYGNSQGRQVIAWLDEVYPDAADGSVEVAISGFTFVTDLQVAYDATKEVLSSDPRVKIVYEDGECIDISEGFDTMETAMTANPNVKIFCAQFAAPAIGADNYLVSKNVNLEEYGVFFLDGYNDLKTLMDNTAAGKSAIRGTNVTGGSTDGGLPEVLKAVLIDGEYNYMPITPMIPINSWDDTTWIF